MKRGRGELISAPDRGETAGITRPWISIIVPVLNESALIRTFLQQLRAAAPSAEIIVVDAGSDDGTPELGAGLTDCVLKVSRGRARQMNAGARVARGEVFWFLHADSVIPRNALEEIAKVCAGNRTSAVAFAFGCPAGNGFTGSAIRLGMRASKCLGSPSATMGFFAGVLLSGTPVSSLTFRLWRMPSSTVPCASAAGCVNRGWPLQAIRDGTKSWALIALRSIMPPFLGSTSSERR